MQNIIKSSIISTAALLLAACGGGGDSSTGTTTTTGVFVDSPVEGLSYVCSSGANGSTNALGEYTCNTGDTVTFSLGGYTIGSCTAAATVSPYTLYPENNEAVLNIAQLLQTLDTDNNPSNGITIAENFSALDGVGTAPTDAAFDSSIETILAVTLVSEDDAIAHINETLGLPSVTNGFTSEWIEGKTLYEVILDTQDDDNDGSTVDWLIIASIYENGVVSLDFSADGSYEITSGITYAIVNGELVMTEAGDIETETITAVDAAKITTNLSVSWGDPDEKVYAFFTKADAQAYMGTLPGLVLSPHTGRVWMDRNLGASRVCTAYNDTACYGDYYQWGRDADGHQEFNSTISPTYATDITNLGSTFFLGEGTITPDWTTVDLDKSLRVANWSKTDGSSVCPVGFRVPTVAELQAEVIDVTGGDDASDPGYNMFGPGSLETNFLKLPAAGSREDGEYRYLGGASVTWASDDAVMLYIDFNINMSLDTYYRGENIRCIKD